MNLETPHGYRNGERPEDLKNLPNIIQAMLMARDPAGELAWVNRYGRTFRTLFDTDDGFRELLLEEMSEEKMRAVQDMLDEAKERLNIKDDSL